MSQKPDDTTASTSAEGVILGPNNVIHQYFNLGRDQVIYLQGSGAVAYEVTISISILRLQILQEPLTAHNLSAIIAAITDLYTRCWLIQQKRFSDLMDYSQTREPRFVREANLQVGIMSHNSPTIVDLLLNAGGIVGGAATLAFTLTKAIDVIAQTPLRYEATKLKNLREIQAQQIYEKQAELNRQIETRKAETEDKGNQQAQQIEAQRKQLDLDRQQVLLDIEKQKIEVEAEKERIKIDRERLEFKKTVGAKVPYCKLRSQMPCYTQ